MRSLLILITILLSPAIFSQTSVGLRFSTGDTEIEAHLRDVNNYAAADISVFRKDLAFSFKATNNELDMYLVTQRMRPADVYYGFVLSHFTGVKVYDVMKLYGKKKGWGSVAKELGIKPGSDQFHKLKASTLRVIDKEKIKGKKNDGKRTKISSGSKNKGKGDNKK